MDPRIYVFFIFFFFSSRRRHTRCSRDWSSDVCSSDLPVLTRTLLARGDAAAQAAYLRHFRADSIVRDMEALRQELASGQPWSVLGQSRSEERRVGKECRSRGAPYHEKKKNTIVTQDER